jgi:hypothetical protein
LRSLCTRRSIDGINGFLCPPLNIRRQRQFDRKSRTGASQDLAEPSGCREVRRRAAETAVDFTWDQVAASLDEFLVQASSQSFRLTQYAERARGRNQMSGKIERKKFAMDSVRTGQQIVRLETETDMREQPGEQAILAAEFRKAAFQLGELRRRDTYLLRRVALLEHERRYVQAPFETQVTESARLNAELADARHHLEAALEAQSAESARLNAELADIRHRITELERALEAQARQLESKRHQGDARRRRTEDLDAALESRSAEVAGLNAQLTGARHRIADLTSALEAKVAQLQSVMISTSWRLTRPLRWVAEKFQWSARQLRRVLNLFWEVPTRGDPNASLVTSSKLFDRDWYVQQNPDVRNAGFNPLVHYLEHGAPEGRHVSPDVDQS